MIFCTRPFRTSDPPSLLYNGHRVSFPEIKRPGRGVNHPPPPSAEVKEREEMYLYSPYGLSWPVLGRKLPLSLLRVLRLGIHVLTGRGSVDGRASAPLDNAAAEASESQRN